MTAEEISSKVRQILQDYRRRNDYTLEDAQRDMANLMGVHAAQQKLSSSATEEEINKMIGYTKDCISKKYNMNYWEVLNDYHSNGRLATNDFIDELLQEFAAQQKSEIKMPTEEEIEEAAYSYACCAPIVGQSRMGFRAGIEWLRNQITER